MLVFRSVSPSIAYMRPGQVTLFLSYQGSRFSVDASFLHSPPPRHTRLAWPASESFDIVPAKQAPKPLRVGVPRSIGVNDEQPVDTTLVICTMFKDEAPYLEEWLQYHRLLGVSKVSIRLFPISFGGVLRLFTLDCLHGVDSILRAHAQTY